VEEAQQQLAAYRTVLTEMQDALNRQDGAAYEALRDKSLAALAEARKAFEAAGAGNSPDPAVVFSYVEVVKLEGDDDLGAEIARTALDKGVESPALWRIYGEMCLATGPSQYAVGVEALQKSTALDGASPESADSWFALGARPSLPHWRRIRLTFPHSWGMRPPVSMPVILRVPVPSWNAWDGPPSPSTCYSVPWFAPRFLTMSSRAVHSTTPRKTIMLFRG
jgi:hypothetical protein